MSILFTIFHLLAVVSAQGTHYLYGPQWGWYSIKTSGYLTSVQTTLRAGAPPSPAQQRLALWPGMNTGSGALIQPIIVSSDEANFRGALCGGATATQWCAFASMLGVRQEAGKRVPLNANDALTMKFTWNEELKGYDQVLSINGKMVSELHKATGKAKSFYIDSECQSRHTGLVNNHTYTDTTLVFSEPVPDLDKQVGIKYMACADKISSADGGKTWKIPKIKVDSSTAPKDFVKGVKTGGGAGGGICK